MDVTTFSLGGKSVWLWACGVNAQLESLRFLLQAGCNPFEVDSLERNALYILFTAAIYFGPSTSYTLQALRLLSSAGVDPHAQDHNGETVYARINARDVSRRAQRKAWPDRGSYHQDVWRSALQRQGIDVHEDDPTYWRFTRDYTPEHLRALQFLDSWDEQSFRSQMDQVLQEHPLDDEETRFMRQLKFENIDEEDLSRDSEARERRKADLGGGFELVKLRHCLRGLKRVA